MNLLHRLRSLTEALLRRNRFESMMSDEMRFHIEEYVADLVRAGTPREQAERRARVEFGGMESIREECRQARGIQLFDTLRQDVRYGLRGLQRSPGFSAIAVIVLGIGIGATTVVFSIVNGVLLEALPYKDPQQLVLIFEQVRMAPSKFPVLAPDFLTIQKHAQSYSAMAAFRTVEYEFSGVAEPQRMMGARVTPELFSVLGVAPVLGRSLSEEDDRQNAHVALLTYRLWNRVFGRNPAVLGQSVDLDGRPYRIVGVMPKQFEFPPRGAEFNGQPAEVFVPMSFTRSELEGFGIDFSNTVVARLKPGISIEQARAEPARFLNALVETYPPPLRASISGLSLPIVPFSEETVGNSRRMLLVLMGSVAMVLLIVCADVANLILTRSGSRQREIAIRGSLGAGRMRIIRQLLTESFVLGILGSALGLALAYTTMPALVSWAGGTLPRAEGIAIDARVLGFAILLAMLTPLVFGILPALRTVAGTNPAALKDNSRTATLGRARFRLLGTLVTVQFALALVLSVGAGLLVRSFVRLLEIDPGFRSEQVVRVTMTLPSGRYADPQQVRSFYTRALEAVRSIPGVLTAGAGSDLPLNVQERIAFTPESAPRSIPDQERLIAPTWTSPGYFESLGIELKQGRFFTEADSAASQPVVIINEKLAEFVWPNENPLGRRIKWGIDVSRTPWMMIVGVVGDVKHKTLDTPSMAQAYAPLPQSFAPFPTVNLVVRSTRDAGSLLTDLRNTIQQIDPALPISKAQPLTDMIGDSLRPQRFSLTVVSLFAIVGLALAAIGIYGVLANVVAQHSREIGIRLALGATPGAVTWMVVRRGLILMAIGMSFGIAGAFAVTRLMTGMLYEIRPTDSAAFIGAALAMGFLAMIASSIPAWRAARVDPLVALRTE
jgi:putative ABC transport system permease protein